MSENTIENLKELIGGKPPLDLFTLGVARHRRLSAIIQNNRFPTSPNAGSGESSTPLERSKSATIAELNRLITVSGSTRYNDDDIIGELSPASFLNQTESGRALRDLIEKDPTTVNAVLSSINRPSMDIPNSNSDKTLINLPFKVYLDQRDEIIARIIKTRRYSELIQKQERLINRIGTTIDRTLEMNARRDIAVEPFIPLWGAHVQELASRSSTQYLTSPIRLTVMLLETLIQFSALAGLKPQSARNLMREMSPMKRVVLELQLASVTMPEPN